MDLHSSAVATCALSLFILACGGEPPTVSLSRTIPPQPAGPATLEADLSAQRLDLRIRVIDDSYEALAVVRQPPAQPCLTFDRRSELQVGGDTLQMLSPGAGTWLWFSGEWVRRCEAAMFSGPLVHAAKSTGPIGVTAKSTAAASTATWETQLPSLRYVVTAVDADSVTLTWTGETPPRPTNCISFVANSGQSTAPVVPVQVSPVVFKVSRPLVPGVLHVTAELDVPGAEDPVHVSVLQHLALD